VYATDIPAYFPRPYLPGNAARTNMNGPLH
jgi:hypothetical protein